MKLLQRKTVIAVAVLLLAGGVHSSSAQDKAQSSPVANPKAETTMANQSATQPTATIQSAPSATEAATLVTPTGTLYGTLQLPKATTAAKPVHVVFIISGSGPTDRDGNSIVITGANNSLKLLAEALAANGIASLRVDKRGVAASLKAATREDDLRFDTYIEDAAAWCRQLRADKRFSKLFIAGHSEGSLIGMVAAQRVNADGFISIAGAGRPAPQLILEQIKPQLPPQLLQQTESILKSLSEGRTIANPPAELASMFRLSVQPYMISWFRYDPAGEIAKLNAPVLIVQGTTDIQVGVEEAKTLHRAKPTAKFLIVEGMNHVLKEVSNDQTAQMRSYGDPTLPVAPKFVKEIVVFIQTSSR